VAGHRRCAWPAPPDPAEATGLQNPIELQRLGGIKLESAPASGRSPAEPGRPRAVRRSPSSFSSCSRAARCRPHSVACGPGQPPGQQHRLGLSGVAEDGGEATGSQSIHSRRHPPGWALCRGCVSRISCRQPGRRTICTLAQPARAGDGTPATDLLAPASGAGVGSAVNHLLLELAPADRDGGPARSLAVAGQKKQDTPASLERGPTERLRRPSRSLLELAPSRPKAGPPGRGLPPPVDAKGVRQGDRITEFAAPVPAAVCA